MTLTTGTAGSLLTPEQVEDLFTKPVLAASVALNPLCSRVLRPTAPSVRLPAVTADPTVAWVAERCSSSVTGSPSGPPAGSASASRTPPPWSASGSPQADRRMKPGPPARSDRGLVRCVRARRRRPRTRPAPG